MLVWDSVSISADGGAIASSSLCEISEVKMMGGIELAKRHLRVSDKQVFFKKKK